MTIVKHEYRLNWPEELESLSEAISLQDEQLTKSLLGSFPKPGPYKNQSSQSWWDTEPTCYTLTAGHYLLMLFSSHQEAPIRTESKVSEKTLALLGIPNINAQQASNELDEALKVKKQNLDFLISIGVKLFDDHISLPSNFIIPENPLNLFFEEVVTAYRESFYSQTINVNAQSFDPFFETLLLAKPVFDNKTIHLLGRFLITVQRRIFVLGQDNISLRESILRSRSEAQSV